MISIIIPTKNEEKYLPNLLSDLHNQTFEDFEIIVADAASTDATRKIARSKGCTVVKGGLPGKGRNIGAHTAKGDILMFLDADVRIGPSFVSKALEGFEASNLAAAGCKVKNQGLYNLYLRLFEKRTYPRCPGFFIMVKSDVFKEINGFDTDLVMAEDHDFVRRAAQVGEFGILDVEVTVSMRRWNKKNAFKLFKNYVWVELQLLKGKRITHIDFEYDEVR